MTPESLWLDEEKCAITFLSDWTWDFRLEHQHHSGFQNPVCFYAITNKQYDDQLK